MCTYAAGAVNRLNELGRGMQEAVISRCPFGERNGTQVGASDDIQSAWVLPLLFLLGEKNPK